MTHRAIHCAAEGPFPRPRSLRTLLFRALPLTASIACGTALPPCTKEMPDVVLTNGIIMDGTGAPPRRGGVAICDSLIVAVGAVAPRAREVIDVKGHTISPGLIDALGQSDNALLRQYNARSKLMQGVTTEMVGEVSSVVPWSPSSHRSGLGELTDYANALAVNGTALNVGTLIALGSLRQAIKRDNAPLTRQDRARMNEVLAHYLEDGAFGLSAALAYFPASLSSESELSELGGVVRQYDAVLAYHLRSESDSVIQAVTEAIRIAGVSGARTQLHHLKVAGHTNWHSFNAVISALSAARDSGIDIGADMYPYDASAASLSILLPTWASRGPNGIRNALLSSVSGRRRVAEDPQMLAMRPSNIVLLHTKSATYAKYRGQTIAEIAKRRQEPFPIVILNIVLEDPDEASAMIHGMLMAQVDSLAAIPWISVGSDASIASGARSAFLHPRTYGTFPRFFQRYVRELRLLPPEEAIRRMSSLPAHQFSISRRGELKEGYYADVAVFAPNSFRDLSTYDEPWRVAVGATHVFVNGRAVVRDGATTAARPGVLLRRGR